MALENQRAFIEKIRRKKFGIGTTQRNPLAGMLHEAIVHLSAELYQKDIHFVSELLQNAEDNTYGRGVTPSLQLVLTSEDIARVGASSTLVLFNNEVGFQPEHIEALCAVGLSTKKGKRNSGYIGEKGIGFKSVFLVSRSPYVISNGYRFRFMDQANNDAKLGYIVPEWVEFPTDADLKRVYKQNELPQTMIILPLRDEKIEAVHEQLKQVSPETLLFLSQLRRLTIREDRGHSNLCITRSDVLPTTKNIDERCRAVTLNLSVGTHAGHISEECQYHLVQQKFPVTHRVEQRKEVEDWIVTIAFPFQERVNSGRCNGDIYAFLPSALVSGFPFIVNADFLLVSSRETLKFDSTWNVGILSCIPRAFVKGFKLFLQKSSSVVERAQVTHVPTVDVHHVYRYIPITPPQNPVLRQVQERILKDLSNIDIVLVDCRLGYIETPLIQSAGACNFLCKPAMGRQILPAFRTVLEAANAENNVNPVLRLASVPWYVIDIDVQERYSKVLTILGVPDMTEGEYIECLNNADWLMEISDDLYWKVIFFVLEHYGSSTLMQTVPLLKYCTEDGRTCLATIREAKSAQGMKIYLSPSEESQWFTSWTTVLKSWVSAQFMPKETARSYRELLRKSGSEARATMQKYVSSVVGDLSVKKYVEQLLGLLPKSNDPTFVILTTDFMYQCCVQRKILKLKDILNSPSFPTSYPVVDERGCLRIPHTTSTRATTVLLPPHGSRWPTLSINSWFRNHEVVAMSDDYVTPPPSWSSKLKFCLSSKDGPKELETFRLYLKNALKAVDLPQISLPATAASCPMPEHLRTAMTVTEAQLLLEWLTWRLSHNSATPTLLDNLKATEWLPTERHGLRRPSGCFDISSFSAFFESSDLPYVDASLRAFPAALEALGLHNDIQLQISLDAVVAYILEISDLDGDAHSCDLAMATRFYMYLQNLLWKPLRVGSKKPKIFVPATEKYTSYSWKDSVSCVIQDGDGLFSESLTILEDLYPQTLLRFFEEALMVPKRATVERYCELWLKWRSDFHNITVEECACVWKIISKNWKSCDAGVWRNFKDKAWVPSAVHPSSGHPSDFRLSPPSVCFLPDDLDLLGVFTTCPSVLQLVWYPGSAEKMESLFNEVYTDLGVQKLSVCVKSTFLMRNDDIQKRRLTGRGIICQGLFKAILGFLAIRKYKLSSSDRQNLMYPLTNVVEVNMMRPFERKYQISVLSAPIVATHQNVKALWSRTEGKLYCLDNNSPDLQSSLEMWDFCTQLATTISNGLLYEHPSIAEDLTEFLKVLVHSRFEPSHVDYELKRKNAKLYEEDKLFLSAIPVHA